ncbi:MAG TPA: prepilin-type N-terminal cleavage/methylation domain-containing protein [Acidimicrobiales bacterium]
MISTLKKLQAKKAAQENNGGFTLIELLIVIVVLGILAAVVVFSLGGVTTSSAVAACKADGATISTAMAAEQAQYPSQVPVMASGAASSGDLVSSYLASIPSNPSHYTFAISTPVSGVGGGVLFVGGPTAATPAAGTSTANYTADAWASTNATTLAGWVPWTGAAVCSNTGFIS